MTTKGIVQPTSTTQCGCNSAQKFQACVEPFFEEFLKQTLAWIDEFFIHSNSKDSLLDVLERFFHICTNHNLVISISESRFFTKMVKSCGLILDYHGVKLDLASIKGLLNASSPRTTDKLCQYVHAMTWMGNSIPRFAGRIGPLRCFLEESYKISRNRTKKSIRKVHLSTF